MVDRVHQGRTEEELLADVERARRLLLVAQQDDFASHICDMRYERVHADMIGMFAEDYPPNGLVNRLRTEPIPELPEAAVREGLAYLATVIDRDGRVKDVLGGRLCLPIRLTT